MNFHDPTRTKLGNWRPCWLNSCIALPPLQLEPDATDPGRISLSICHGARGVWLEKSIPLTELHKILHFWTEDPEGTFMQLFGLNDWPRVERERVERDKPAQPSKAVNRVQLRVPINIEDLI